MLQVAEPAAAAGPVVPRLFRVRGRRRETRDTVTVDLQAVAPADESGFTPGQFNMLYVFGIGEVPISISGDPGRVDILAHTVRAVGAVTRALAAMKRGALVGVRGPFGTSWPVDEAEGSDVVIVAGGVGLAPLRPALYRLLARREKFGRIVLLYGARTPGDLLHMRELERWRSRMDLDVAVTVDAAAGKWRGSVGVVTTLIPRAPFDPASSVALVCGPEVMMRFTVRELQARGVRDDRMFLSMERNMKCGIGLCGHCQYGPFFICRDGPIFRYDLSLVEGSISTPHDAARIQMVRRASRVLVTIGACATAGGIQALRNFADVEAWRALVYAHPDYVETLATSTPVAAHVAVDFELRGCPINKGQLVEVLTAFLHGRRPAIPADSVCLECKRRGTVCVMVADGTPCLGPITQAGCGAICPAYQRGCYGCYGPMETPNATALADWWRHLGVPDGDIARALRTR